MTELQTNILKNFKSHTTMKDRDHHTINELLYILSNDLYFAGANISISIKTEEHRWYCIPDINAFVPIFIRSFWFNDNELKIDEEYIDDISYTCITITAISNPIEFKE